MPRGNHKGFWRPNDTADIYRSRWKRFYKRCYRPRSPLNNPDDPPPHFQPQWGRDPKAKPIFPDGVPSPWVLQYSLDNFGGREREPPDAKRFANQSYEWAKRNFHNPAMRANNSIARDLIIRSLDPGRKGGSDTGYGRAEVSCTWGESGPAHLQKLLHEEVNKSKDKNYAEDFLTTLKEMQPYGAGNNVTPSPYTEYFYNRRLYKLYEEKEIAWLGGQLDVRKLARKGGDGTAERGHFPYVDEQASLIDDLQLKEILRFSRHRINRRRHFKWLEISYQYKKWHQQYLRRRAVLLDEAKARMGVLKETLSE